MEVFRTPVSLLFSWAAIFNQWHGCWFSIRNHRLLIWQTSSSSILVFIITICHKEREETNYWKSCNLGEKKIIYFGKDDHFLLRFWLRATLAVSSTQSHHTCHVSSWEAIQPLFPSTLICKMGSNFSAMDQETGSTGSWKGFSYQG